MPIRISSEQSGETDASLMVLHNDVEEVVSKLRHTLSVVFRRNLYSQVDFKHEYEINEERFGDQSQCNCLLNCTSLVVNEASIGGKSYSTFFKEILRGEESLSYLQSTIGFGPSPILEFASGLDADSSDVSIESGGGSGFGFQVYCNHSMVLTGGVGGGGGIFYDFGNPVSRSFGGGGGGGVQLLLPHEEELRLSIGGGGGCGTCNGDMDGSDHHSLCDHRPILNSRKLRTNSVRRKDLRTYSTKSETTIHCGFKHDDDASDANNFRVRLIQAAQEWQTCNVIEVYGGGGGGGGTDLCCQRFQVGYGFSFTMAPHPITTGSEKAGNDDNEKKESKPGQEGEDVSGSGGAGDYRYQYDFVGALIDMARSECGDDSSWCCTCSRTQTTAQECLQTGEVETSVSDAPPGSEGLCSRIRSNPQRINWIFQQSCCTADQAQDSSSASAPSSSFSPSSPNDDSYDESDAFYDHVDFYPHALQVGDKTYDIVVDRTENGLEAPSAVDVIIDPLLFLSLDDASRFSSWQCTMTDRHSNDQKFVSLWREASSLDTISPFHAFSILVLMLGIVALFSAITAMCTAICRRSAVQRSRYSLLATISQEEGEDARAIDVVGTRASKCQPVSTAADYGSINF